MGITRRRLLILTAAAASACNLPVEAAEGENALFWRVAAPGKEPHIMFGYMRIAASLVPDIVRDGERLLDGTQRMVGDVPSIEMSPTDLMRKDVTPILESVSRPVADELRVALAGFPDSVPVEMLSGLEVSFFLMGEGGGPGPPYVGTAIADHAEARGHTFSELISEKELREQLWQSVNLAAWNRSIGEPEIVFLLDLRRRVGPIGAHLVELYRTRRGEEIAELMADMRRQGISSSAAFMAEGRYLDLLLERMTALLRVDVPISFVALPIDVLAGQTGVLAQLEAGGHVVTPVR